MSLKINGAGKECVLERERERDALEVFTVYIILYMTFLKHVIECKYVCLWINNVNY